MGRQLSGGLVAPGERSRRPPGPFLLKLYRGGNRKGRPPARPPLPLSAADVSGVRGCDNPTSPDSGLERPCRPPPPSPATVDGFDGRHLGPVVVVFPDDPPLARTLPEFPRAVPPPEVRGVGQVQADLRYPLGPRGVGTPPRRVFPPDEVCGCCAFHALIVGLVPRSRVEDYRKSEIYKITNG